MVWFSEKNNIKALLKALSNEDKNKRNQAAREFLTLGADGAEDLVLALGSQEANLSEMAARILFRLDAQALPALNAALQNASLALQEEVAKILGQLKSATSLEILFSLLKDENYKKRILAVRTLGEIGHPDSASYLLVALADSDPDVRSAAVTALGKIGAPQTYVNIADLLDDAEINVRIAAAKTLGEIKDASTIPYLVDALHDSFWWYGREDAIQTLLDAIASFGRAALDELIDAMDTKEPTVRRYAIALLRPLREPRIMDALEMAFYDTNYDVAESALAALLEFGEIALPKLAEALLSPNIWIREKTVWGLGEIGGEEAVIYLLEILNDDADSVRKEAIESLTKLKDPRALPTLRAISSKRENREIAKLARQAIAEIEAP